ncbi:MAG: hypothetical protein AB1646_14485 [Thermodesulfobacteriota bacterium]
MIVTEEQRRWWFATHPEYSSSHRGSRGRSGKGKNEDAIDPRDVDEYVDDALKYETDDSVIALLQSVKRNFGTQAEPYEHDESRGNRGDLPLQPKEPQVTIGPPKPPDFTDRTRSVLDFLCPGLTKAYDRWRTGYYEAYPWAPGPLYDALGDLMGLAALGLTRIEAALSKAANAAEIAALQTARQELLEIWNLPLFPRGWAIEDLLKRNLPRTFKGIDRWENGVATSIKSMDLRAKFYQDPAGILSVGQKYVDKLVKFRGAIRRPIEISADEITERVLRLAVPPGATKAQRSALRSLTEYGRQNNVTVEVIRVP